jgi:hypothetical protein
MSKLGTVTWMQRTGGRLAWHDKLTLLAQGVLAQVANQGRSKGTVRNREVSAVLPPRLSSCTRGPGHRPGLQPAVSVEPLPASVLLGAAARQRHTPL